MGLFWSPQVVVMLAVVAIVPLVSGCAPGTGGMPAAPILVVAPEDVCGKERGDFAKSKTYFTDQIVTGIGTGAVLGTVLGGAAGLVLHVNPVKTAAIGAGVGAAVGGISSYSQVMVEKHKDEAELARSVNDDLTKEGQEIDRTTATFARLRACRFQQATYIKTQVRRRAMDRTTAMQQLSFQKGWFDQELDLAKTYRISMEKRGEEFKDAANTIKDQAQADAAKAQAAAYEAQAVQQAASVSIPNKRASFDNSIASAVAGSEIAFNLDSNKKVSALALPPRA